MNMRMTVEAPAKINLFLDITGRRNDGYHLVNMVMQTVSLYDDVTVAVDRNSKGISVSCSDSDIPCDSKNTAYRAAEEFFRYTGTEDAAVNIRIKKRIPSGAGMAGGSADAAAVIYALNQLFETELDSDEMEEIGELIGADVPFCIYGGTMTAGGIGTILSPLPDMPDCHIAAVKPSFRISTPEAYKKSDSLGYENPKSAEKIISAICNGNVKGIGDHLYNKFEAVVEEDEIDSIKKVMMDNGAEGALMTGSGSAVFGIFVDRNDAENCCRQLEEKYENVYLLRPVSHGPKQIQQGGLFGLFSDE